MQFQREARLRVSASAHITTSLSWLIDPKLADEIRRKPKLRDENSEYQNQELRKRMALFIKHWQEDPSTEDKHEY